MSSKTASRTLRSVGPRNVKPFAFANDAAERMNQVMSMMPELPKLGIYGLSPGNVSEMMGFRNKVMASVSDQAAFAAAGYGMDSLTAPTTTPSITTPIQWLQYWLPGFVGVATAPRLIDEIIGISTTGDWADEEIVQGQLEGSAKGQMYSDAGNVPLAGWNVVFEARTIVRWEMGMRTGLLEEARAAKINVNSAETKRNAATEQLEIFRNDVGFNGFNSGDNKTYGFLNDPNLNAATAFPSTGTGSSPLWSTKTFQEIQADLRLAISTLRTQSNDLVNPKVSKLTMVLATDVIDYLSVTTDQGISVQDWLDKSYPGIRIVSCPQLENAIAGDNGFYLFAEQVNDQVSTDDKNTWIQGVPAKFKMLGVSQQTKGYEEDYSNATAGAFLKRAYAVVRFYGC